MSFAALYRYWWSAIPQLFRLMVWVAELARCHDLPASSMMMHRLSPNEFLLVLSNEDDAVCVYNKERPIQISQITLHC